MTNFTVLDLLEIDSKNNALSLECIAGKNGLDNEILSKDINRPGLALSGFFEHFASDRIQIFGKGESLFLKKKHQTADYQNIERLFVYKSPCYIFTYNDVPPDDFLALADKNRIPVLISKKDTGDLISAIFDILSEIFAKKTSLHGVLIEVFGVGILLRGKSGIGKSETALELVQRGHRLVADDMIELTNFQNKTVIGKGSGIISHHMEIRGLGIINIKSLYGVGTIRDEKKVQLVVELEEWDPNQPKEYDRIGIEDKFTDILGIKIPCIMIPVMPGRNIPIIIETAAMNQRLKIMGVNAAREFNRELMNYLETEEIKNTLFSME